MITVLTNHAVRSFELMIPSRSSKRSENSRFTIIKLINILMPYRHSCGGFMNNGTSSLIICTPL